MEGSNTPSNMCVCADTHADVLFFVRRGCFFEHIDTTWWLTQTFVVTPWFYGCVYMPSWLCVYVCISVLVESSAAGGCQQHTNKLSGENQSGVWNDSGWGNKQQQLINVNWLTWRAGMRFSVLFGGLVVALESLCCYRAATWSYTKPIMTTFWLPSVIKKEVSVCSINEMWQRICSFGIASSTLSLNSFFIQSLCFFLFVVCMQSPSSHCMHTQGRTQPNTAESSGHVTGAQTANTLWLPVGTRR